MSHSALLSLCFVQAAADKKDEPSEKEMYDRALRALEEKKRQLLEKKKQQQAAGTLAANPCESASDGGEDSARIRCDLTDASEPAEAADCCFSPAACFGGAREGMVFKLGSQGLGYYLDKFGSAILSTHTMPPLPAASVEPPSEQEIKTQVDQGSAEKLSGEGEFDMELTQEVAVVPGAAADLDDLD